MRRITLSILICFLLFSLYSCAQKSVNKISLNGEWEIIFDDNNEGKAAEWFLKEEFEKNDLKKKIQVPSCWEEFEENYEGAAIYMNKFHIPESWSGKVIELNFDAVNYLSEVWINDQVVGFHEGGYTPFSFRVDKLIKIGEENVMTVRVISPIILTDKSIDGIGRQEVPMWRGGITGGIWQSVSISAKGTTGLKDVFVEPHIDTNTAVLNVEVENTQTNKEQAEITLKIISKDGEEVAVKSEIIEVWPGKNAFKWEMPIKDANYWSVDNPYLYTAKIEIKTNDILSDQWSSKFGMREFSVKDDEFTLNGEPIYLKATFFEGLYPVKLAYPDSREMAIKEITLAKEAGFNMIRPWRKPAPPMWLDLCDSLGVLTVGSLVTECMHRPISTPRLPFVVENELRKTIMGNRNRTCIVQWELFNEINRRILAQMLNSMSVLARELDPTRMILDESGGWGEGANIFLPYQRTPKKFNDIHHYSGSQVCEQEFNGYLATAKNKEDIAKLGIKGSRGYGKNVVSGMMTYISELGYGSTPDLTANNEEFDAKGNPIVAPTVYHKELNEGYKAALKKVGFDKIYPNVKDFYVEQQTMHGIANKRMLEATRLNSTVKGYCVHALVGGDWVIGAGLLDLWRNPKTLVYDMTKEANQSQIVPIRILPRNIYAENGAKLKVYGVSELQDEKVSMDVVIESEKGKQVYSKYLDKDFVKGISELFLTQLDTKELKGSYTVKVSVKNKEGKLIASNYQSFDVFKPEQVSVPKATIAVVDPANSIAAYLKKNNYNLVPFTKDLDKNIPVFVGKAVKKNPEYKKLVEQVKTFVEKGGYAVLLDVAGENISGFGRELKEIGVDALPFNAEMHGKWATRGGWAAKSHIVTKHPVFKGLPTEMIMHGVYENIHPVTSMSKIEGKYIAGMIGYDHFPNNDIMVRHYNGPGEVWYAADVLEVPMGKGEMMLSTLRIIDFLGKDPVAEVLLNNMIEYAECK